MAQRRIKVQVWWHLRDPKSPGSFALSYRPCDAETDRPLEDVAPRHLEQKGNDLPPHLGDLLPHCVQQIHALIPPPAPRDFGLGEIPPQYWLEAFSFMPMDAPGHERGDLLVHYRYHWHGFVEHEHHQMLLRVAAIPKSLAAMLGTFTRFCEEAAWADYKARYKIPAEAVVSEEYRPPFLFISFRDRYRDVAEILRDHLVARDFAVFLDHFAIATGKRWRLEIGEALEKMEVFIPLVSPDYAKEGESLREYQRAREREARGEIRILPVLLEGRPVDHPEFSESQMILLTPERRADPGLRGEAVERLIGAIFGVAVPGLSG